MMGDLHLHLTFICQLMVWTVTSTGTCNDLQYLHNGKCCDLCPKGTFVKSLCGESHKTVCNDCPVGYYSESRNRLESCHKCSTCQDVYTSYCNLTKNALCSCQHGLLCLNQNCTTCGKKPRCGIGQKLERKGSRDYTYECMCPDSTYYDTEKDTCIEKNKCSAPGLSVNFPGNKTHNAICALRSENGSGKEDAMIWRILLIGFFAFGFGLLMYRSGVCIKRLRRKKSQAKEHQPAAKLSVDLPDTHCCQVSVQESGGHLDHQSETKISLNISQLLLEDTPTV